MTAASPCSCRRRSARSPPMCCSSRRTGSSRKSSSFAAGDARMRARSTSAPLRRLCDDPAALTGPAASSPSSRRRSVAGAWPQSRSKPPAWLQVVGLAVSDATASAILGGKASELMSLMSRAATRRRARRSRPSRSIPGRRRAIPARSTFVKIDAEGAEAPIVAGGRDFFASRSPLVMLEVAPHTTFELPRPRRAARARLRAYRLVPGSVCSHARGPA